MKNKLSDLNNHLFAQLERLGDESLQGDALKDEIERGKSMASVAKVIEAVSLKLKGDYQITNMLQKLYDIGALRMPEDE